MTPLYLKVLTKEAILNLQGKVTSPTFNDCVEDTDKTIGYEVAIFERTCSSLPVKIREPALKVTKILGVARGRLLLQADIIGVTSALHRSAFIHAHCRRKCHTW